MNIAYTRISTADQNPARQIEALSKYNIDRWYQDEQSGKDTNRPKLQEMLDFVREGDTIYIHEFTRLARSTRDLLELLDQLQARGVHLHSDYEQFDTSTPTGRLLITMVAAIAEFERRNLLERQREGIAIAKREGRYRGGQPKRINDAAFADALARYQSRQISKSQMAAELGISRPTLNKLLAERT